MKKNIFLIFICLISQVLCASEMQLSGMACNFGFLPDFWTDILHYNPAFSCDMKETFGFSFVHKLEFSGMQLINKTEETSSFFFGNTMEPQFLWKIRMLTLGTGLCAEIDVDVSKENGNETITTPCRLGGNILLASKTTENWSLGLNAGFYARTTEKLHCNAFLFPGFIWQTGKYKFSFSFPITYACNLKEDIPHQFSTQIVFLGEIPLTPRLSLRFPGKTKFQVIFSEEFCYVDIPISAGGSIWGSMTNSIRAFAATELSITPGNSVWKNGEPAEKKETELYFHLDVLPHFSAGLEGDIRKNLTLRAGASFNMLQYRFSYYKHSYLYSEYEKKNNQLDIFSALNISAGVTFHLPHRINIDLTTEFNHIDAAFSSEEIIDVESEAHFQLVFGAAVSLFH